MVHGIHARIGGPNATSLLYLMRGNRMELKVLSMTIALMMLVLPVPASAALGANVASVQADQIQMNGTLRSTDAGKYTQYEIQTPSGTLVREYVSSAGAVFAVAWEGPSLPDLKQLLGTYFEQYVKATKSQGGRAGPRVIQQSGLVVHAGGHMRAFLGRAYVPQMLPEGVNPEEVQ
jgi:hypothetical protein